ncbi:MAG: hypothetical protein BWY76_01844 [bacterium ADurb.Bin429]|nr:MAG: hypothetical protein BWY76_01844 [bacterium ADurb.Bin429]
MLSAHRPAATIDHQPVRAGELPAAQCGRRDHPGALHPRAARPARSHHSGGHRLPRTRGERSHQLRDGERSGHYGRIDRRRGECPARHTTHRGVSGHRTGVPAAGAHQCRCSVWHHQSDGERGRLAGGGTLRGQHAGRPACPHRSRWPRSDPPHLWRWQIRRHATLRQHHRGHVSHYARPGR